MLANLTLKSRLFLSYLVYLVFLSIPGAIAPAYFYLNYQKFVHQTPEIRQNLLANQLSESKIKMQESILGYVSTKDQVFVDSYYVSFQQLNNAVAAALRSNIAAAERTSFAVLSQGETDIPLESASYGKKILRLTQQLNGVNQYILDAIKAGKTEQAIRAIGADESRQIWADLTAEIEKVRIAEIQAESLKLQAANTSVRQLIFMGALATVIFFLLAIALGLVMTDRILARGNQLLDPMVKSSVAIAQEMNEHEQSAHNQALMFSAATPQLRDVHEFSPVVLEQTTSICQNIEEISLNLREIQDRFNQIKDLKDLSDRLVDYSKKISLNISLKNWQNNPENARMFILLNTEIKKLTNQAQKIAQTLNQIVRESEDIQPHILSFTPPIWGSHGAEGEIPNNISNDVITDFPPISGELIDRLVLRCEKIKIKMAELASYSQEQVTKSEQILQTTAQLEAASMTTACGIGETNLQIQKLKQLAEDLKLFLGDAAA
jgi:methyl-accepting chemotaxis protein